MRVSTRGVLRAASGAPGKGEFSGVAPAMNEGQLRTHFRSERRKLDAHRPCVRRERPQGRMSFPPVAPRLLNRGASSLCSCLTNVFGTEPRLRLSGRLGRACLVREGTRGVAVPTWGAAGPHTEMPALTAVVIVFPDGVSDIVTNL